MIRMTGCPNSCGRPSMAEIGFIGKAPGTYNMYMGPGPKWIDLEIPSNGPLGASKSLD